MKNHPLNVMAGIVKKVTLLVLLFTYLNAGSQSIDKAKNIISIDFGLVVISGAAAAGIGINYERMINDYVSIRTGINIGVIAAGSGGSAGVSLPLTVNFMTKAKNKFELGLGGGPRLDLFDYKITLLPAAKLGYRYQPDEKGMFYRIGLDIPANFYLSTCGIGYHF
jgi:hypothetical protein